MWMCTRNLGTWRQTGNPKPSIGFKYMLLRTESMQVSPYYMLLSSWCVAVQISYHLTLYADLPDEKPVGSFLQADHSLFVPTENDCSLLRKEFLVLVARVLVQYVPCLQIFQDFVPQHILHTFSHEMTKASEIVSFMSYTLVCNNNNGIAITLYYLI